MTKSFKRHLLNKCFQDNGWKTSTMIDDPRVQQAAIKQHPHHHPHLTTTTEIDVLEQQSTLGMDLSRVVDDHNSKHHTAKDLAHSSSNTSKSSSRSNSVEENLKIVDRDYIATKSTASNPTDSGFVSLTNCTSAADATAPYHPTNNNHSSSRLASPAAYNVNQDFLIRMAMQQQQQNDSSVSNSISSNSMLHNAKLYNNNLAAVAAAVANGNSHSLYQSALSSVTSAANPISNSSTISAAHHLAALNGGSGPHTSAFQNLQSQSAHSSHQLPHSVQHSTAAAASSTGTHLTNGHSSGYSAVTSQPSHNLPTTDHLLSSITNGANQSLLAGVTNGLINTSTSLSSTSNLSNNGSTNSSISSSSSGSSNNAAMLNEQLLNQNLILASQSHFVPSTLIESSTNNLFVGMKKRKRSPQPIPQVLKDDAYWDRRRRNNESAKRSREVRRIKEQSMHIRLAYLEKKNLQLATELEMMREEAKKMHDIIYCQRYGQGNQQDKHNL